MKSLKSILKIWPVIFLACLCFWTGCGKENEADIPVIKAESKPVDYSDYAPAKADIMPLTAFATDADGKSESKIKVYVGLFDEFNSQIKSPGVFRFELYEKVPRTGEPKGARVAIWPDIDLNVPAENNKYWRDFLRAYEFGFDFEPKSNQNYILQVTCQCPNGKRLSADFPLNSKK